MPGSHYHVSSRLATDLSKLTIGCITKAGHAGPSLQKRGLGKRGCAYAATASLLQSRSLERRASPLRSEHERSSSLAPSRDQENKEGEKRDRKIHANAESGCFAPACTKELCGGGFRVGSVVREGGVVQVRPLKTPPLHPSHLRHRCTHRSMLRTHRNRRPLAAHCLFLLEVWHV